MFTVFRCVTIEVSLFFLLTFEFENIDRSGSKFSLPFNYVKFTYFRF